MKNTVRVSKCRLTILTLFGLLGATASSSCMAATMPSSASGSRLYYHLAGQDPVGRAPHRGATSIKLGLTGTPSLNYSCGRFDASLTISQLANSYSNYGDVVANAIRAGVANLPMYVLQRTQPGLYELIQTYIRKAEEVMQLAYKSCEQMESETKDGRNPWDGWVTLSMGESWKWQSSYGQGNVAYAKDAVHADAGKSGFTWVFGNKAGGAGQPPAKIVGDTTIAAYNLTMGKATTAGSSTTSSTASRLTTAFPTAADAGRFATEVLGETEVASCSASGCPTKATQMALGLQKQYDTEITAAQNQLGALLSAAVPSAADLSGASAPGVAITRDLVEAIRTLPKTEGAMAAGRLANEVALARTVDRALLLRQLLVSGQTIPAVEASKAVNGLDQRIADLDAQIKNLMFEVQTRKQLVSTTAQELLGAAQDARATSLANSLAPQVDQNRLINGRIVK